MGNLCSILETGDKLSTCLTPGRLVEHIETLKHHIQSFWNILKRFKIFKDFQMFYPENSTYFHLWSNCARSIPHLWSWFQHRKIRRDLTVLVVSQCHRFCRLLGALSSVKHTTVKIWPNLLATVSRNLANRFENS